MTDDMLFDLSEFVSSDEEEAVSRVAKLEARAVKARQRKLVRRSMSEAKLTEILPSLTDISSGDSWHVISGGDVDSLSFVSHLMHGEFIADYLLISTWCMAMDDVRAIAEWIESGRVERVEMYVGEIFPNQYHDEYTALCEAISVCDGRVAVFRNHSKVALLSACGKKFAVESSANVNANPRTEQTAIHCCDALFDFYKSFFDGITSFNREFDAWQHW